MLSSDRKHPLQGHQRLRSAQLHLQALWRHGQSLLRRQQVQRHHRVLLHGWQLGLRRALRRERFPVPTEHGLPGQLHFRLLSVRLEKSAVLPEPAHAPVRELAGQVQQGWPLRPVRRGRQPLLLEQHL